MNSFTKRLKNIKNEINKTNNLTNYKKRIFYSLLEILKLDLNEINLPSSLSSSSSPSPSLNSSSSSPSNSLNSNSKKSSHSSNSNNSPNSSNSPNNSSNNSSSLISNKTLNNLITSDEILKLENEINEEVNKLNLSFVQSKNSILYLLHDMIRLGVVILILFTAGIIVSLPMLILRVSDGILSSFNFKNTPYKYISVATKVFICNLILLSSGVVLKIDGLEPTSFSGKRTLACFTHGSTIDAFVLGAILPIPPSVLAKKELFLLPYFGWLLQAYGSVPIDRKNRKSAVVSLEIATEIADCVIIAPEGTRSTTGQLLPFKKGPFHLWESLNGPIVPIVINGAFELLPPGIILKLLLFNYCS